MWIFLFLHNWDRTSLLQHLNTVSSHQTHVLQMLSAFPQHSVCLFSALLIPCSPVPEDHHSLLPYLPHQASRGLDWEQSCWCVCLLCSQDLELSEPLPALLCGDRLLDSFSLSTSSNSFYKLNNKYHKTSVYVPVSCIRIMNGLTGWEGPWTLIISRVKG